MFLQLWPRSRTRKYQAARDRGRLRRAYRPGLDALDERCLLSAHVVIPLNQAIGAPALVAFTIAGPKPAPSGGAAKAASPPVSYNPGAGSSATNGATGSTNSSLANPTGAIVSSITELAPNLFVSPLTTTAPPAASVPPTPQSAVIPFGSSIARAAAGSFARSLLVGQEQFLQSAHLGQVDALGDSEAFGSAVDEKKQEEQFVKIIEKPKATAPTKAPEQRPGPAPAPKLVPIVPDASLGLVLNFLDYGLLTTLFEAESSRPESAPNEPDSSPRLFAMLGAAALSSGSLALAILRPNQSFWRRVEKSNSQSCLTRRRRRHRELTDGDYRCCPCQGSSHVYSA